MFWGCMIYHVAAHTRVIEGRMYSRQYVSILANCIPGTFEKYGLNWSGILFQNDNDSKYTSNLSNNCPKDQKYEVLKWPAQSPHTNPFEHL